MVMKILLFPLTSGLFTIVDDEDFEHLSTFRWTPNKGRCGVFYAATAVKRVKDGRKYQATVEMQRYLLDPNRELPRSVKVDHINGQVLDNRRSNLRLVNDSARNINRRTFKTNKSGYRGVSYAKEVRKWLAQIKLNKKAISIGYYFTQEEAAIAYNAKAIELHGEYACLNVIPSQESS
jgi:hypothetical protein